MAETAENRDAGALAAERARQNVTALRATPAPAPATAREGTTAEPRVKDRAGAPPTTRRPRRGSGRKLLRWGLLIAGPLLVAIGVGWFWLTSGRYVGTDNAYVQADTVNIATDVGGLVAAVEVRDNQRVTKGQELFQLDDSAYRAILDQAQAQLDLARAEIENLRASYAQMQAEIQKAEDDIAYYEKEYRRQQDLAARRIAPEQQLDAATHNLNVARSQLAALQQQEAGIAAQLDGKPDAPVEEHARYQAALAARDKAARDLAHTVVKAPMDGIVAQVPNLQPGNYLAPGQAAFALIAVDHVWVEGNPKETDLTYVRDGQPVTITVDTYPGYTWHGDVESLSPGSQAQFSLLPAQNTSGNWVKVVQRIPIRVRVETPPDSPQLRAGMSAELEIDTGHQRHLSDLLAWL